MEFDFIPEDEEFRKEVRDFLDREVTPGIVEETESGEGCGPHTRRLMLKLGAKRWLAGAWPEEYGGSNFSHLRSYILMEEMAYRRCRPLFNGAHMAGPVILMFGSDAQKKEYLPRIARGEIEFALGYTEPHAGSDLAALEIRAVSAGDHYVVNGQKLFSSGCHYSEYHWLAVRTDPRATPRHRGISMLIVDLKSPGITIRPLTTTAGWKTNEVFYDDVRVPKRNRVGEENRGWYCIAQALDLERMFPVGDLLRLFEEVVDYARQNHRDGRALGTDPTIRQKLAQIHTEIEVARLLGARIAWMQDSGQIPNYESSVLKLLVCETWQRMSNLAVEIMGLYGQLGQGSPEARLGGRIVNYYLSSFPRTIFAGSSEIQRTIIATRGLGLPHAG